MKINSAPQQQTTANGMEFPAALLDHGCMFSEVHTGAESATNARLPTSDKGSIRIMRLPAVIARVGLSRSSIYARMHLGTFPRAVRLGPRSIGFVEAEITTWLRAALEQRTLTH